jgi:integral membrane protein
VKTALLRYRVMANVVGVLLIVLVLVGLPLHYGYLVAPDLLPKNGQAWQVGADISKYLGVAHGWLYMIFLVMAFLLSRKARWDLPFTVTTLLLGTVPVLSFWAEHRATARVRAQLSSESTDRDASTSTGVGA